MNKRFSFLMFLFVLIFSTSLFAATANVETPRVTVDGSSGFHGVPAHVREGMNLGGRPGVVIDSVPTVQPTGNMGLGWDGTYLWNASNAATPIQVYQIDPVTGAVVNTITTQINSYVLGVTYLNGSLWIQEWSATGTTYEVDPTTGNTISSFSSPAGTNSRGLTNDGTDLWIMDAPGGTAYLVTTGGSTVRTVSLPSAGIQWAMDCAWNHQRGTLFIVDDDVANDINELDMSGASAVLLDEFAHPDPGNIPEGITYDGQYLWTTAFYASWIWKIDIGDPPPSPPYYIWDFEEGWEDWTHTNGLAFPEAWDVLSSAYKPLWTPPDAGDSTMWIDSDAAGVGVLVQDTALSPVVVPPTNMNWLKYGLGHNNIADWVDVGLKYFDGAVWNVVTLKTYTADFGPAWDSIDVSAYAGYDSIQVFFYYEGNYDWYAGFDNVSLYAPASHDVGTIAINAPGTSIMPNTTLDPTATYTNFGNITETFDIHFYIEESGTPVYDEFATVTLDPGVDTTHAFPSWTCGSVEGTVYDIYAYTVYAGGDDNPGNDTLYQSTFITSAYWEILDPPTFPAPTYGHSEATAHDGYYYVFSCGVGNNELQIYDIANNSWSAGPNNPSGMASFGTADFVVDNFYRIGGWNGGTALNIVDIYDPVAGTWSSGANAPALLNDHITGVYNDSLIFSLGGGNWFSGVGTNTNVYFYDVYNDAWTTATNFPSPGRGCLGGGVIDTFAIVACGFDDVLWGMRKEYIVGVIDPANPATIAWGAVTDIPGMDSLYRMCSGVDPWNKELWLTQGQKWADLINRTWSYSPYTDVWTEWLFPKPQVVCNLTPIAITTTAAGDLGLYVAGGYNGSSGVSDHEVFHTGRDTIPPGVTEEPGTITPTSFGFAPDMPTLTNAYMTIKYSTTENGNVSLKVYDATGRLVRTLVNRPKENAGEKIVYWNGKDNSGRTVATGVYFFRLEAENKTATKKAIIVR